MACMQYIAFDFETSGLPEGRRNVTITPETLKNFDSCRAVSLSAARFSNNGRLVDTFDAIIYPDNFIISQDSIDIHGITNEQARAEGRPFPEVFVDFLKFVGPRSKNFIAHNAQFDTILI
jgi:DNA polymerase III epsilon subunit-like protein